jgi:class 3 adenylate cyclase/tetratricopeptide (TPR) repeat protein
MRCPRCKAENAPAAKFCGECGAPFESSIGTPVSETGSVQRADLSGERRHLTVLFCDLVGSTAIAAQLDPEEWRETVAGYHRAAAAAMTRFDGYVAKYLGDGVMAYFGWPAAHDNDAERAACAGLALIDAIAKLNEQPGHAKLTARVGIDSGLVVIGKGSGHEAEVFGDAPNIAARVQAAAEPSTVAISDATHRLVSGLFIVEDRGAQVLKGIERPTHLYRVLRPSGARGRFDVVTAAGGLTSFVGREDELRSLMNRWERALEGEGQIALVIGEAGIGKSRLVQRFREQIAGIPHTWVEAGAGAFFQNTPFYSVSEMLRQMLAGGGNSGPEDELAQLEPRLALAGLKAAEAIPLIAPLLNLPLPPEYQPSGLSPEQQRRRLLATLVEWVLGSARAQPLIIATEDLHWADPSTLELIQLLVEQGAGARLLLLYTARPEFHAPWPMRAHHTQINLNRLSSANVRTIVAQVAAKIALSEETVATVVERTGGVPLFVEELTRAVLESGDAKVSGREIPATLHDSLMARLDRLGTAKEVIQIGAVIGSEFSYELLHAVHPIAEEDLHAALRSLADAELLYVRGIAPDVTYQFKHALIRDAAYEALLKSRRKELHLMVARIIDKEFIGFKDSHPEVLAHHWTEAGEIETAIAQWSRAGAVAHGRNAFKEALENYRRALALLNLLPESTERDHRELEFMQPVVSMLYVTSGWAAAETNEASLRTAALAERSGNLKQFANWIGARAFTALISGDLLTSLALADKALELCLREGNATSKAYAYLQQTMSRFYLGDLEGAEKHFTIGLKFFDDAGFRRNKVGSPIAAFAHGSWIARTLGRADVARERLAQMMTAANADNPHDLAMAGDCASFLQSMLRDYEQAEASALLAVELSEKHQFPNEAALARCALGHARAGLGRTTEGIFLIRQGIAGKLEYGHRLEITRDLAFLTDAQASAGAVTDALETVEQALCANLEEIAYRPEALRLRGELRLRRGDAKQAEGDFREAIVIAQKMQAKAWELRATMILSRLLAKQGRRDQARAMLAEIYGWFTEGFDTPDLRDAKALLDELRV